MGGSTEAGEPGNTAAMHTADVGAGVLILRIAGGTCTRTQARHLVVGEAANPLLMAIEEGGRAEEHPCLRRVAQVVAHLPMVLLMAADTDRIDHEAVILVAEVEQATQLHRAVGRGEGLVTREILLSWTKGAEAPMSMCSF